MDQRDFWLSVDYLLTHSVRFSSDLCRLLSHFLFSCHVFSWFLPRWNVSLHSNAFLFGFRLKEIKTKDKPAWKWSFFTSTRFEKLVGSKHGCRMLSDTRNQLTDNLPLLSPRFTIKNIIQTGTFSPFFLEFYFHFHFLYLSYTLLINHYIYIYIYIHKEFSAAGCIMQSS